MTTPLADWRLYALGSAAFAAATAVLGKVGVEGVGSNLATFIRVLIVVPVLLIIVFVTGEGRAPGAIAARTWIFLTLSGLATGASWLCYYRALQLGPASRVAPVDKLSVVFVALISVGVLGERLSLAAWLGVALIATGGVIVALA